MGKPTYYSPMVWDPYYYFKEFEAMVNNVFLWILVGFAAINVGAIIFCAIKNRGDKDGFFRDLGIAVWLNVLGLIAVFAICCVVYSSGVYFKNGNYTLGDNYYNGWIDNVAVNIIFAVLAVIALIVAIVLTIGSAGWFSILIGLLAAGITYAAFRYGIGFIIYILIWLIWLIIRLIYVMLSCFGLSIYKFAVTHWMALVLTIGIPAVIIGLVTAGIGYVKSLREEVYVLTTGSPKFTGAAKQTVTASVSKKAKKEDEDDIVVEAKEEKKSSTSSSTKKSSGKYTSSNKSSAPAKESLKVEEPKVKETKEVELDDDDLDDIIIR